MDAADPTDPEAVPPRRSPMWPVGLAVLGVVVTAGGLLTVLLYPPPDTFGWFAYAPLSGEGFPGGSVVTTEALVGWTGTALGLVLLAFCAGWLVGRRGTVRRRGQEPGA